MLYVVFCYILLIPLSYGAGNITLPKIEHDYNNKSVSTKESPKETFNNKTKLTVASERGSLLHNSSLLSLKDNITINLMTLEEESSKTKEKPIQPRKGVGSPLDDNSSVPKNNSHEDNYVSVNNVTVNPDSHLKNTHLNTTNTSTTSTDNVTANNINVKATVINKTEVPKKPLVLSYETLAKLDPSSGSDQAKIALIKSSTKATTANQMPSPNKDLTINTYSTIGSEHPGMVTPIVITILVVPMFAVLGYMALRRGQEAWKNRHYKRMDFLLDGMYND